MPNFTREVHLAWASEHARPGVCKATAGGLPSDAVCLARGCPRLRDAISRFFQAETTSTRTPNFWPSATPTAISDARLRCVSYFPTWITNLDEQAKLDSAVDFASPVQLTEDFP
jgi:hypothetical protein